MFFDLEWEKKSGRKTNWLEKFILYYAVCFDSHPSWWRGTCKWKVWKKSQWTCKIHIILRIVFSSNWESGGGVNRKKNPCSSSCRSFNTRSHLWMKPCALPGCGKPRAELFRKAHTHTKHDLPRWHPHHIDVMKPSSLPCSRLTRRQGKLITNTNLLYFYSTYIFFFFFLNNVVCVVASFIHIANS